MLLRPVQGGRNIYKYMPIFIYRYMYIYIYGLEKKIYKSIFIGCEGCWKDCCPVSWDLLWRIIRFGGSALMGVGQVIFY